MKNQKNKVLTATQKKNKYRALQYATFGGEFISILTPFITMGAINYQDWFMVDGGWKVGLGGALSLALLGMAIFLVGKKKEDNTITNGFITLILGWFAVAFIFLLLANIMDQIATIMMFGGIGLMGAFGLNIASQKYKAKADMYIEAKKVVELDNAKEEIKKELGGQKENGNDVKF